MNDFQTKNELKNKTRVKDNMVSYGLNFYNPQQEQCSNNLRYYRYYTDTAKLQQRQQKDKIRKYQQIDQQIKNKKISVYKRQKQVFSNACHPSQTSVIDQFKFDRGLSHKNKNSPKANISQRSILQKQEKLDRISEGYKRFLKQKLQQQRQLLEQNYKNVLKQRKKAKKIIYEDNLSYMNQELQRIKKGKMKYRQVKSQRFHTQEGDTDTIQFKISNQKQYRVFRSNSSKKVVKHPIYQEKSLTKINSSVSIDKSQPNQRKILDARKINYLQHLGDWQKSNSLLIEKLKKKKQLSPVQRIKGLKDASQGYKQLFKNGKKQAASSMCLAAIARAQIFLKQVQ